MDSWSRGGRGRGNRGRGRGDYNNSYNSNYSNNNGGGDSGGGILSRLGPMADGNSGFSTNNFHQQQQQQPQQGRGRGGYQNNNSFDHNNSNSSYQQQGRGRGGYQNNNNFDQNNSNSNYQQSPRGGRNQTFSSRGRGRGGRGGNNQGGRGQQFTRDLADDDIDMGHDIPADAPVIMVSGYPPEGERTLLNFLHRKSKAAWEELNVQHQGGVTYITVDTPATAENLLRKNGFTYMNAILSITLADGSTPSLPMRQNRNQRPNQQQGNRSNSALAQFLQERWYPEQGYLNLDDLPPTSHSITLVISKLLNEANINYGNAVVTISFARNKLWSFQPLNKLPLIFPDLQNLSLQENDINKFKGIDSLSNKNLPRLTELVLLGNPIQVETPPDVYIREVTQRFPSLLQLDFQPVSQSNGGAFLSGPRMGNDGALPFPIKTSFFDQDNSRQAAQDLLSK
ncbi:hypothetical protein [Absidia glauca]|uniref:Mex67 RNA recognition motif domain-containing protein n=1 Tax=Absidia glauca TaxID=4829 RepID=A0A168NFR1_ABSGL|nr:hypothetical protein [Absidia glauca]